MGEFLEGTGDTSEAAKSQYVVTSSNPLSLSMPDGMSTAPLSLNEPVPGTSQEFPPPKEDAVVEKPGTSVKPLDVSIPSMPVRPVGLLVTCSGWTSRPPSHLKDCCIQVTLFELLTRTLFERHCVKSI